MIDTYDSIIEDGAAHIGCDWRLFKAQLWQESRLKPDAKSPVGARGIAQIMPDTWDMWHEKAGYYGADIEDPEANIMTGAYYMQWLIDEWKWPRPDIDRHCLALASYNAGLGHILEAQKAGGNRSLYKQIMPHLPEITGVNSMETINYVVKILDYYQALVLGREIDE